MKKTDENLNYLRFFSSFYFFRSLRFLFYLNSKNSTNVLVYYPQYFNQQSKPPLFLKPLIKSLKKNNLSYVVIEEPNIFIKKNEQKMYAL